MWMISIEPIAKVAMIMAYTWLSTQFTTSHGHKVPSETQLVDHVPFFLFLLGMALTMVWLGRVDI
jgi:hypothetical protein